MHQHLLDLLDRIVLSVTWEKTVVDTPSGPVETVELPAAADSDYRFNLHLYPHGERGISAVRVGADANEYFWHKQFELADYSDADELDEEFLRVAEMLLTRETLILQKKGLIWSTFRLVFRVRDHGITLNFVAAPRISFRGPRIQGRKKTYRSSPLGDDRSQQPEPAIQYGSIHISLFERRAQNQAHTLGLR